MTGTARRPKAPAKLGRAGRALWSGVVGMSVDGRSISFRPDELVMLAEAAKSADTIADLEASIAGEALLIEGSRGQLIVHPAVIELRLQRAALATLLHRLAIPDAASEWDKLSSAQRARRAAHARWSS